MNYDCLYRASLRVPLCRDIFSMLKRQIAAHFEWNTRRWAMPFYIEFDQSDRWQRVTLLCLHLRRSVP